MCKKKAYKSLNIVVIPGNHDPDISDKAIITKNVHVIEEPTILHPDPDGPPFLFVPYSNDRGMGEVIEGFSDDLPPNNWVLVGHGDYSQAFRLANPYEPGIYMPLTSKDIERYQPRHIFLGHIHIPHQIGRVYYTGSPCGLDITETGRRRFLVFDTGTDDIQSREVDTDIIFLNEKLIMLPVEDESAYIRDLAEDRIRSWNLTEEERSKTLIRLRVEGYCADKETLDRELREVFSDFSFENNDGPDLSGVSISDDIERRHIVDQVKERIEALEWREGPDEPDDDDILLAALSVVYKE